jgi:hypothetical protein
MSSFIAAALIHGISIHNLAGETWVAALSERLGTAIATDGHSRNFLHAFCQTRCWVSERSIEALRKRVGMVFLDSDKPSRNFALQIQFVHLAVCVSSLLNLMVLLTGRVRLATKLKPQRHRRAVAYNRVKSLLRTSHYMELGRWVGINSLADTAAGCQTFCWYVFRDGM